jgi:hypothetical protein
MPLFLPSEKFGTHSTMAEGTILPCHSGFFRFLTVEAAELPRAIGREDLS